MRPARSASPSVHSVAGDDSSVEPSSPESPVMVWSGDKGVDWLHARQILKDLQTDGRHITIWRQWLSQPQLPLETSLLDNETPTISPDLQLMTHASPRAAHDRDCARAVLDTHVRARDFLLWLLINDATRYRMCSRSWSSLSRDICSLICWHPCKSLWIWRIPIFTHSNPTISTCSHQPFHAALRPCDASEDHLFHETSLSLFIE